MPHAVLGVLVTHAALGTELRRTAEQILGPQSMIEVISNTNASIETLSQGIRGILAGYGDKPIFLFVDLLGGSCGHVCQEVRRQHPATTVFSGVNLPMFLEFLHHRDRVGLEELKERLLTRGRDGIQCLS